MKGWNQRILAPTRTEQASYMEILVTTTIIEQASYVSGEQIGGAKGILVPTRTEQASQENRWEGRGRGALVPRTTDRRGRKVSL